MKDRTKQSLRRAALTLVLAAPIFGVGCGDEGGDGGGAGGDGAGGGLGGDEGGEGGVPSGTSGEGGAGNDGTGGDGKGGHGNGGTTTQGGSSSGRGGRDAGGQAGDGPVTTCDFSRKPAERLPSDIETDTTLDNAKDYLISGIVRIHEGATLTIPPCTRLMGTTAPDAGALVALRGGRLVAVGTPNEPILFTSTLAEGRREGGQWGGVILLGRAPITPPDGASEKRPLAEGLSDPVYTYGAERPDQNDDSGNLSYVRIEYAGYEEFNANNVAIWEFNGLTLAGVGSGTTIDHVMVSNVRDDCFEWWGGTVKADHLVANNCGDEYFSADEDWQGGGRYWFGRRAFFAVVAPDPNGLEMKGVVAETPSAAVSLSHLTLCGVAQDSFTAQQSYGFVFGDRLKGSIDDVALAGFDFAIDTRGEFEMADLTVEDSTFWELVFGLDNLVDELRTDDDAGFLDESLLSGDGSNDLEPSAPPFSVSQCVKAGEPGPDVLESGLGAFADGADWMRGTWVDWSEE